MASFQIQGDVRINAKALARLKTQHPWIFKSDIMHVGATKAGLVRVLGPGSQVLGTALFSPNSQITLRMLAQMPQLFTPELLEERLVKAIEHRKRFMANATAYRLIHGESDLLPGIFVDVYGDSMVVQALCAGSEILLPFLYRQLQERCKPRLIVVRNDAHARLREGLPQQSKLIHGEGPTTASYQEGRIHYEVDLLSDHKTGAFLDQARNHVAFGAMASGVALDCFTYQGGFALQMAGSCSSVLALDSSAPALERGKAHAARAGIEQVQFEHADVFKVLPELYASGQRFDTIVLDPPAFASGKGTLETALRAYKDLNSMSMRLLKSGGLLCTCSCSGRVDHGLFEQMLQGAALETHRMVHVLARWGAGPDHPIWLNVPETDYLKCRVLSVL